MELIKFLQGLLQKKDDRKKQEIEIIKEVLDTNFSGNNNHFGDELSGKGFISGGLNFFTKIQVLDQQSTQPNTANTLNNNLDQLPSLNSVSGKYQELLESIENSDLKIGSSLKNQFKLNFELGYNAKNLGLMTEAKKRFENCYKLQPRNYRLISRYTLVLLDLEEFDLALSVITRFLKSKVRKSLKINFDCNFLVAKIYDKQGQYTFARKAYLKSLNILKKANKKIPSYETKIASVYCALGHIALVYSELNHAQDFFNRAAIQIGFDLASSYNGSEPVAGKILNCCAISSVLRNDYKIALEYSLAYKRVVHNIEKEMFIDPYDKVLSLLNLATVYFYNQEYKLALELAEQAKDFIYENFGESFSLLVNVFGVLSISYMLLDQDLRSEKYFMRCKDIHLQKKSVANSIRLAVVYSHRGNAFKLRKKFNLARQNYSKALEILNNIFDPENLTLLKLKLAVADTQSSPLVIVTY